MPRRLLRQAALRLVRRIAGGGEGGRASGQPRRLLFLQFDPALGSVVNATPLFEAVKRTLPEGHITVAASGLSLEVLQRNPFIDRLIAVPDPHRHPAAAARALLAAGIRRGSFDAVLTDAGNMKARIGLLAALARSRSRIGFSAAPELYDVVLRRDPKLSMREEHFRLAGALGAAGSPGEPRVYFGPEDAASAKRLLEAEPESRPRVALVTQTSGGQPTRWFDDRFAALADHLGETQGAALYFLGTAGEAEAIDRLRARMRQESVNLAGRTGIAGLTALLCQCDLVVSLDTGTMHLARAAGVPTVVIAAAWQPAYEWLPLGVPTMTVLRRDDIGCRDCRKISCATHECMAEIEVGAVIAAIEALWKRHPPSVAAREARLSRSVILRQEGSA